MYIYIVIYVCTFTSYMHGSVVCICFKVIHTHICKQVKRHIDNMSAGKHGQSNNVLIPTSQT